jgi:hypothetical protein
MTRFSRLLRVCAWCHALLGVSEPTKPGHTGATHTICQEALEVFNHGTTAKNFTQ